MRISVKTFLPLLTGGLFLFCAAARADEGMWLPMFLKQNEARMQELGFKLTAEDVYDVNASSLKDAVVIFGGGCTGEVVSPQGLVFTNHHCGYGYIQEHSSLEHDYLTDGFWAESLRDELPCPGLKVRFLKEMRDVSEVMLAGLERNDDGTPVAENVRRDSIDARSRRLMKEAAQGEEIRVVPFYYGNQYFLFVYEVYEDVRLVGAPPSNIGKFGGDTDNWMFPRHTGDFSVFRIYADTANRPAPYSPENKPYSPKRYFKIDLRGCEEGDFTMVIGYPGRTQEYLSSYGVEQVLNQEDPMRIEARTLRLEVIKAAMNRDAKTRIQYAAKAASIANGWKKWIGEAKGIERLDVVGSKREYEKLFGEWTATPEGAAYASVLPALQEAYEGFGAVQGEAIVFQEYVLAPEAVRFAYSFKALCEAAEKAASGEEGAVEKFAEILRKRQTAAEDFYKNYNPEVDREIFEKMAARQAEKSSAAVPDPSQINLFYTKSVFTQPQKMLALLQDFKPAQRKTILNDPLYRYALSVYNRYITHTVPAVALYRRQIDSLQRVYMRGQMEMQKSSGPETFYPDANFTMRVAYGQVNGFSPSDALVCKPYTTLKGIMEKENPDIYDYVVEERLKELYRNADYGRYANKKGEMPVAFIGTNHTTGGNSGSPVLNAEGNLVGINFDRNWEGTMSDIRYDAQMCRNIMLDIRYCLFIIDKFAGARRLIDELEFVEN
ncbi:MAG: S46 family peptidase [Bacteroidales bacterium]|nr:S46 family peptidase [Bacteroidales bacterium]